MFFFVEWTDFFRIELKILALRYLYHRLRILSIILSNLVQLFLLCIGLLVFIVSALKS